MSEFIKRNLPVFIIGLITVGLFVFIIVTAQTKPATEPELIQVEADELIAPHTYVQGSLTAPVVIVEFSDFGCPACKSFHPVVEEIIRDYPNNVAWAYRHFPLPQHRNADQAAAASQVAGEQGKFWEYGKVLFENQGNFDKDELIDYARQIGLDTEKFENDLRNSAFDEIVNEDIAYATQVGVNSTPTFFLNGRQLRLSSLDQLRTEVERELEKQGIALENLPTDQNRDFDENSNNDEGLSNAEESLFDRIDETYGTLEISYTSEGFEPKDTKATTGQKVVWTNNSEEDLVFVQLIPKYEELLEPKTIAPGETFEFRLRDIGLWTYRAEGQVSRASIFIQKLPESIAN